MDDNDVRVKRNGGEVRSVRVASGAVGTLGPGEPIKQSTNYAILLATGDPEVGTDEVLGLAMSTSSDTVGADGRVNYQSIIPAQTVWEGAAHTPGNIDTDAKLLALEQDWVAFDLTSTAFTINEDEGSDQDVHGLKILTGDIVRGTLDVLIHSMATEAGTTA